MTNLEHLRQYQKPFKTELHRTCSLSPANTGQ
jgi:hypothetical protein